MFANGVSTAVFINDELDLIIGHQRLISVIQASTYLKIKDREADYNGMELCTDNLMKKLFKQDERLRSNYILPPDPESVDAEEPIYIK